jgi:SAM-dependent methyltransferase
VHQPSNDRLGPGLSTAGGGLVEYRIDRLVDLGLIHGRWLDCGCADGAYAEYLRRSGAAEVVGTDVNGADIELANRIWGYVDGISFIEARAEALPFADGFFDGVLLNEVLEHVSDEVSTLAEVHRVLRNDGRLVVYSPNRWFPFEQHGMLLGRSPINYPIPLLPWLPSRLTRHVMKARNWWPDELRLLVANAGFDIPAVAFAFPLLNRHRWLPNRLLHLYRRNLGRLQEMKIIRRFGISTLIIARKIPTQHT